MDRRGIRELEVHFARLTEERGSTLEPGHTVGGQEDNRRLDPLTRRNSAGETYRRTPAVEEEQIRQALHLGPDALRQRVGESDRASPAYFQEEALVYLIRHYHRAGERDLVSDLADALLRRCAKLIDRRLGSLGGDAPEEGYSDVVEQLFSQILDPASDRGDFLQVRFWPALEKLAVRAFNRQLRLHKRAQGNMSFSSVAGYDPSDDEESAGIVRPAEGDDLTAPSGESDVIRYEAARGALGRIKEEDIRSAFLLRHYSGWPIEDKDPAVRTISRHFGKDPRTIRNWLARADAALRPGEDSSNE